MKITRPRATKLSQLTVDCDLAMGAHNITLGVGQTVDGRDVSGIEAGATADQTLAEIRALGIQDGNMCAAKYPEVCTTLKTYQDRCVFTAKRSGYVAIRFQYKGADTSQYNILDGATVRGSAYTVSTSYVVVALDNIQVTAGNVIKVQHRVEPTGSGSACIKDIEIIEYGA